MIHGAHGGVAGPPESHQPSLVVIFGGGRFTRSLPIGGKLLIGRSSDCDVPIEVPSISRRHALIYGTMPPEVEDLGSSNGTWVGGERIPSGKRVRLAPLAVIELGEAMIIVNYGEDPSIARALPTAAIPAVLAEEGPRPSASMAEVRALVDLVAGSMINVILLGETGVGKDVLAQAIFRKSPRANKPFLRLNCAALPDALLESELFGFEPGAFSGATRAKPGLLETAHGGTIFLDEVGEMPLTTQAKLLRALETREVTRLGGIKPRLIDVRLLAATNRNLHEAVAQGKFRGDLFYRLEGISISVPPLRERRDEITGLAETFVRTACERNEKPLLVLSKEAAARLDVHPWPGNVRELKNVIERTVLLCDGPIILPRHLTLHPSGAGMDGRGAPTSVRPPPSVASIEGTDAGQSRERTGHDRLSRLGTKPTTGPGRPQIDVKREVLLEVLELCGGNQSRAAALLGISRGTLLSRLDTFDVPRPRKKTRR
jgi:two-component system, NtrC family, response regulator AtoC